jgi:hypothetical protein
VQSGSWTEGPLTKKNVDCIDDPEPPSFSRALLIRAIADKKSPNYSSADQTIFRGDAPAEITSSLLLTSATYHQGRGYEPACEPV